MGNLVANDNDGAVSGPGSNVPVPNRRFEQDFLDICANCRLMPSAKTDKQTGSCYACVIQLRTYTFMLERDILMGNVWLHWRPFLDAKAIIESLWREGDCISWVIILKKVWPSPLWYAFRTLRHCLESYPGFLNLFSRPVVWDQKTHS